MVRRKEQFPNEGALDRFIMTQVMEYNDKFENRAHRGFKDCHDTLDSMFWNCPFMRAKFLFLHNILDTL